MHVQDLRMRLGAFFQVWAKKHSKSLSQLFQNDLDQTAVRADQRIEDSQPHFLLIPHAHLKKCLGIYFDNIRNKALCMIYKIHSKEH